MAVDYAVIRQESVTVLLPGNVPTPGKRVWFTIHETGTTDFVDVPDDLYTPQKVKDLIQPKVDANLELFSPE